VTVDIVWDIRERASYLAEIERARTFRGTRQTVGGEMTTKTYWNYEPTPCRRVVVRVGKPLRPTWWCADLEGQERKAVEVDYFKEGPIYLDDEDGRGWNKVTGGRGGPEYGHRSLPDDSVVLRERDEP